MPKTKFTPGPWTIKDGFDKKGNGDYFPSVFLGKPTRYSDGSGYHKPNIVINESHDQEAESIMANAYLIHAAPDMYEALEYLLECSPCQNGCASDDMTCANNKAKVALSKARGENS